MAFQAQDGSWSFSWKILFSPMLFLEPNGLQNTYEYTRLETAHHSQNAIADPVTNINFSSSNPSFFLAN